MESATYAAEAEAEEHHWWFRGRRRLFAAELARIGLRATDRVLDIGTSTGTNLRLLRELGVRDVTGIDTSTEAVAYCAARGHDRVELGDAAALPFPDESFDVVIASDVIEHLADDAAGLAEIRRVLKPGGTVLLTVPAFRSLWGLQDRVAHHRRRYRLSELRARVDEAGLSLRTSYYFNYLLFAPIWLARRLIDVCGIRVRSENELNNPLVNALLYAIFSLDVATARHLAPPFGVSALALAVRPGAPEATAADTLGARTIRDFGRQWTHYTDNDGYYASTRLLQDTFGPLLPLESVRGRHVAEIGSGTGRIIGMLMDAGAATAVAIEPSDAFVPLTQNLARYGDRVTCLHCRGEETPANLALDFVFSIGVLHHIPDPLPVLKAAHAALRPGGRCLIWLYGHEGNETYLTLIQPLRRLTTRLPHRLLALLSHALNAVLGLYIALCRVLPLPLRSYMLNVIGKFTPQQRHLVVYDQLNPAYARYYRRGEALALMQAAGFADVRIHHRHGYSWTVLGTRAGENG